MYTNALEFLEEERDAWQPFEALAALADDELERAVDRRSPTRERMAADWDARGDALNEELVAQWRTLPLTELRRRAREQPGELRGTLTTVPEARWLKDPDFLRFFVEETIEHYEEHRRELEAILARPAGRGRAG